MTRPVVLAQARLSRLNVNQSDCEFQMIQHVNSFGVFRMCSGERRAGRNSLGFFFLFIVSFSFFDHCEVLLWILLDSFGNAR